MKHYVFPTIAVISLNNVWFYIYDALSRWFVFVINFYVYPGCFWHCIWHDKSHDKPLNFIRATFRENLVSHHWAVKKAVFDTVFDMINVIYHDKPLIFIGATSREKLVSHHWAVNEGCFQHCTRHYKCRLSW